MKKVVLFSGSNSSKSINSQLISYVATLIKDCEVEVIDLRDYEPPLFGVDLEAEIGTHPKIHALIEKFQSADGIIISTPEHNSMPPAFFKNILDWLSRVQKIKGEGPQFLEDKPTILMSTSPGKGAAMKSRALVRTMLGYGKANVLSEFSLPSFNDNFQDGAITDQGLRAELIEVLALLQNEIA